MTRIFFLYPLILLTAILSTSSNAQTEPEADERWFQAEIIVFEIREQNAIGLQEIWPDDPGLPNYDDIIELSPFVELNVTDEAKLTPEQAATLAEEKSSTEPPFQRLPEEALTMTEIAKALAHSANYVPLLHIAWRQPVTAKETAQTIYLHDDQIHNGHQEQPPLETAPAFVDINNFMPPPELVETPALLATQDELDKASKLNSINRLDGTVKLHLGRYLHLEADLLYRSQIEPIASNTFLMSLSEEKQPQTLFRMQQTRRMRSGELHYFDHPKFGLLVQITPYELPEPAPEPEPEPAPEQEAILTPPGSLSNEDSKGAKPLP